MADKISISQRALPKVTSPRYISSQRYTPHNVTLKKKIICILRPVPAYGGAPVQGVDAIINLACRTGVIFCVFQVNIGESEASAKRELRGREGALKTNACSQTIVYALPTVRLANGFC